MGRRLRRRSTDRRTAAVAGQLPHLRHRRLRPRVHAVQGPRASPLVDEGRQRWQARHARRAATTSPTSSSKRASCTLLAQQAPPLLLTRATNGALPASLARPPLRRLQEGTKAITPEDLLTIRPHLDPASFADARDWCACLFAFFGLLRIKEYTCAGLLTRHVSVVQWGINLAVPFSKTSLIPTAVAIIRRNDTLCPVAAHHAYTARVPSHFRRPGLPFLLHSTSSATPLSDVTFTRSVRRWVRDHLHESPDDFSGHSFRRGGATATQLAGVPESTIAAHGRWKSLAYRTYFDVQHSLALRLAATAPLLAHSSGRPRPTELLPRLPPPP